MQGGFKHREKDLVGVSKIYIPSRASIGNASRKSSLTAGYNANEPTVWTVSFEVNKLTLADS